MTYDNCLWENDTWAQGVAGPPIIQPKAGAVEGRGVVQNPTHLRMLTKGKSDPSNRKIS